MADTTHTPRPVMFDPRDTRGLPPLNELKAAWDLPLPHEDPLADEERRLLSVAQCVRDCYVLEVIREGPLGWAVEAVERRERRNHA